MSKNHVHRRTGGFRLQGGFVHRQTSNQWPTHGIRLVMHHVVFYTGNYILNIFFKSRVKRTRKMEVVGDDEERLASIFDRTATRVEQPLRLGQSLGSDSLWIWTVSGFGKPVESESQLNQIAC